MTTTSTAPRQTIKPPAARRSFVERWLAMIFLAPTLVGMALFTFLPIIGSLVLAFFRWDIISAPQFVGFANFASLARDPTVRVSFLNTIVFVVVAVILQLGIALSLASMLQARMPSWLRVFLRSTFFFPLVLSAASVSIFMRYMFNEQFGVVNWLLSLVGIPAVPWLTSPAASAAVVVLVYVWQNFGFSFLLFLGALTNIPKELHEAANLDGAHRLETVQQCHPSADQPHGSRRLRHGNHQCTAGLRPALRPDQRRSGGFHPHRRHGDL
jgi:multiple sugar transport system permease protein